MKLTVLAENTKCDSRLCAEHGLSFAMEACGRSLLFDTGSSDLFARNAETLSVDLSAIDIAVLSHAHYDHGGGLRTFLSLNDHAPVYISRYAFDDYQNTAGEYIGIDPALQEHPQITLVDSDLPLGNGLSILSGAKREPLQPVIPYNLTARREGRVVPDDFRHEQYLLIEEAGKRILISGCSHKGIINIMHWCTPDIMIGGLHLVNLDPETGDRQLLDAIAADMLRFDAVYYGCHCTGEAQYAYLKQRMPDRIFYISSGQELTL